MKKVFTVLTLCLGMTLSLCDSLVQKATAQSASNAKVPNKAEDLYDEGLLYYFGFGVTIDHAKAVSYFRKAAELGHAESQCKLGDCYQLGEGVKKNDTEAVKWFRMAADQGNAYGQYNLAYFYENGLGVKKDTKEAIRWYRKAAEQGDEVAKKALQRLGK